MVREQILMYEPAHIPMDTNLPFLTWNKPSSLKQPKLTSLLATPLYFIGAVLAGFFFPLSCFLYGKKNSTHVYVP